MNRATRTKLILSLSTENNLLVKQLAQRVFVYLSMINNSFGLRWQIIAMEIVTIKANEKKNAPIERYKKEGSNALNF